MHQTKPELEVEEILYLLPDFDRYIWLPCFFLWFYVLGLVVMLESNHGFC